MKQLVLAIILMLPTIATAAYPPGVDCVANFEVGVFAFVGPGVASVSGLPAGLVFPGIFGADWITGTPTTGGIYAVTINGLPSTWVVKTAHDGFGMTPERITFTVGVPSTAQLSPVHLTGPSFYPPQNFYLYHALYTSCPPRFPVTMPPGLTLNIDGTISGTPTTTGTWAVEVAAMDAAYQNPIAGLAMTVSASSQPPPPDPPKPAQHRTTSRRAAGTKQVSVR